MGTIVEQYELIEERRQDGRARLFKARDCRLDRNAWVEVFPAGVAPADTEAKLRFMEDAFLATAAESPRILPVLAFLSEGANEWVVMEYARGRTLDRWIAHQRISSETALRFALHIAEALEAAHGAGVTHGDLRPANILIPEKGPARVFNFGFQHVRRRWSAEAAPSLAASGDAPAPAPAAVYEAPERLAGAPADVASDLYSFGCILYELMAGRPAVEQAGATPLPLEAAAPGTRECILEIVDRCLRSEPAGRFSSFAEVRHALERAREPVRQATPADAPPVAAEAPAGRHRHHHRHAGRERSAGHRSRSSRRLTWILPLALCALALVGYLGYWFFAMSGVTLPTAEAQPLTRDPGWTMDPSISLDGAKVLYASDRAGRSNLDIYLHDLMTGKTMRVTDDSFDESEPAISPEGSPVVYRSERDGGGIYSISPGGAEPPVLLVRGGRKPRISPRGDLVAYWVETPDAPAAGRAYVIPLAGGVPTRIGEDFAGAQTPLWSPDGSRLLFLGRERSGDAPDLFVTSAWGGAPVNTHLYAAIANPELVPTRPEAWKAHPDRLIFDALSGDAQSGRRSRVFELRIDPLQWKPAGFPRQVSPGLDTETAASVSDGGLLVFARSTMRVGLWRLPFEHDETRAKAAPARVSDPGAHTYDPAVTRELANLLTVDDRSGKFDVWSRNLAASSDVRLTSMGSRPTHPVGAAGRVVFGALERDRHLLFQVPLEGGPAERLCDGCGDTVWDISKDGRRILHAAPMERRAAVVAREIAGGSSATVLASPDDDIYQAAWSPDERWLTFLVTADPGKSRLYLTRYRGAVLHPKRDWIELTKGEAWDGKCHWSPDGRALYFLSSRDGYRCLWALRLGGEDKRPEGLPFPVYHSHGLRIALRDVTVGEQEIAVTPDAILFNQGEFHGNVWIRDLAAAARRQENEQKPKTP